MEGTELQGLLVQRRYGELAHRLSTGQTGAWPGAQVLRLRAELSVRGRGPLSDALAAGQEILAARDRASLPLLADAIRLLSRSGAEATARGLWEQAGALFGGAPELALLDDQLARGPAAGATREEYRIHQLIADGDLAGAVAALEAELSARTRFVGRRWSLRTLADLYRGGGAFDRAAGVLEEAHALAPDADDAPAILLSASLARWSADDPAQGLPAMRRARDRFADSTSPVAQQAHAVLARVLRRIDQLPEGQLPGPRWVRATVEAHPVHDQDPNRALASRVLSFFGQPSVLGDGPFDTMAHLVAELTRRGMICLRVVATPTVLEQALGAGAAVVLEEERPSRRGRLMVLGIEPVAGLLLLHDPERWGPFIREVGEQWHRSAAYGHSALLVTGTGFLGQRRAAELSSRGVTSDPALAAIDRCDLDDDGRAPPAARVVTLAQDASRLAPDAALPRLRLGEALLEQTRLGKLQPGDGELERWYAQTRQVLPAEEWPFQIYARALELAGHLEEAGIAWADAASYDPFDERNLVGMARVRAQLGDPTEADRLFVRALCLCPGDPETMARRAQLLLTMGRHADARLELQIAADVAPGSSVVLETMATLHEQEDAFVESRACLARLVVEHPERTMPRLRLLRRALHDGLLDDAREAAEILRAHAPDLPETWEALSAVAYAGAEIQAALDRACSGVERCGPDPSLLERFALALITLPEGAARAEWLASLERSAGGGPPLLLEVAGLLSRHGAHAEAESLARAAAGRSPGSVHGPWRLAQVLLAAGAGGDGRAPEVLSLLEAVSAHMPGHPQPLVVRGHLLLDEDPERALSVLHDADQDVAPALVWGLLHEVHARLHRADDAVDARERLRQLDPEATVEAAVVLRNMGLLAPAARLLEAACDDHPEHGPLVIELARVWRGLAEPERALGHLDTVAAGSGLHSDGRRLLVDVALACRRWQLVSVHAGLLCRELSRQSSASYGDRWPMAATQAAAELALGRPEQRSLVLSRAPDHPGVRLALYRVERAIGSPLADDDARRLGEIAPGLLPPPVQEAP